MNDGSWHTVADVPVDTVPVTVSFAPVTARRYRLVLVQGTAISVLKLADAAPGYADNGMMAALGAPPTGPIKIAELRLSSDARVDRFEAKAGFSIERDY
jgi:hypothetical protein